MGAYHRNHWVGIAGICTVANLPEELLTDAIVRVVAGEHDPRLLHYLPERYRTPELVERIFDADIPTGWRHWDLEYSRR